MTSKRPVIVSIGEILWDILPSGRMLGGAPANVAWHAAQLGADSRIVSAVGRDPLGDEILAALQTMNLDTSLIFRSDKPTGTVEATIDAAGGASYVIHQNVAWDDIPVNEQTLEAVRTADAVNFGSLAQRTDAGKRAVTTFLDHADKKALRVFDVNLRPGAFRKDVLTSGLARSDVVKLNWEELATLGEMLSMGRDPATIPEHLFHAYPAIRHLLVTRGAEGAWWKTPEQTYSRAGKKIEVADTIGAGDSLTAAVAVGLLRGFSPEEALSVAMEISSYVCTQSGGTPVLPEAFRNLLERKHPERPGGKDSYY